ncbi:MAG: DNA topoisomerase IV subunit A [Spirochaetales bacterium]|nr:DNA topoisomerase IV subunit A [Spirochaetales bacterium]
MAHATKLFDQNFIEYASYVIRDRAIPDITDGFKPVQRRIIHTLIEMDDGRFHKVAGVVGAVMKYHPHGDASINDALVNLANCDLLIEGQGNFGNALTGDPAAAGRYIECRLLPIAKKILYSPEITEYVDSYDGRNKEPVVFQAKIPIVVIQGTSGIAVGMRTDILPHNLIEVLDAEAAVLRGEDIELFPDFASGGIMDVSGYDDGKGYVTVRARLDVSDPKKVVITELPYGVTTEQMIDSIKEANDLGKLHIARVDDYTAEQVNIEISLQRNTYASDIVDALYAYTKCETKISVNPIVIDGELPRIVGISEMVRFHSEHLLKVLQREQEIEKDHLREKLHARTLERIFVEERIYKKIENKTTEEAVKKAVVQGFKPFEESLIRPINDDDIDRLLKIPIRRISLFDMSKNLGEIATLNEGIEQCDYNIAHITEFGLKYLEEVKEMAVKTHDRSRKTEISSYQALDIKSVAVRNLELKYDQETGYIGTNLKTGEVLLKVSPYDKVFYMKKDGSYRVVNVSEKDFVGTEGLFYWSIAEKDEIAKIPFTVIYKENVSKFYFIKRFNINSFQTGKLYSVIPDGKFKLVKLSMYENAIITAKYKPGCGYRVLEETFRFADFAVRKSSQVSGNKLITKQLASLTLKEVKDSFTSEEAEPGLFD